MDRLGSPALVTVIGVAFAGLAACDRPGISSIAEADAAFADLQDRGHQAMGVDQYTSSHVFDALPDGGRIELQRDGADPDGIARIRQHLQEIARAFDAGEFDTPAFVHAEAVPGASVMAAKRDAITYTYRDLPRGGEVRIVTQDPQALQAIHEFMSFQRQDHRAGGLEHGGHGDTDQAPHDHGDTDHAPHDHGDMDHAPHDHGGMDHDHDAAHGGMHPGRHDHGGTDRE